jgi:DNA helicase II / ATP-dependent DNA helicase PcrA
MDKQEIIEKFIKLHNGDEKQLEVICSEATRLMVEAPAGYGKTKTLISKIAFLILNKEVPANKRILALTFSINASFKMKRDIMNTLPYLLSSEKSSPNNNIDKYIFVSNYHGLCRRILKKYGYLLNEKLKNINELINVDDSTDFHLSKIGLKLSDEEKELLFNFCNAVKESKGNYINKNYIFYNEIIKSKFLEQGFISFNSIISLTIELLTMYKHIRDFYIKYFPIIIIDEFQDTNILNWSFLQMLISKQSKLLFLGDSLQRIYGFIGAVPHLMDLTLEQFDMDYIRLEKNYRFKNNNDMLLLEKNIRENAKNPSQPSIQAISNVKFKLFSDQIEEATGIINQIKEIQTVDKNSKIAILVKQRGPNINLILEALNYSNVDYFYGLFSDEDQEYKKFHKICLEHYYSIFINGNKNLTKKSIDYFIENIKSCYVKDTNILINSLIKLLQSFLEKVLEENKNLQNDDKHRIIIETFLNNSLKQSLDNLNDEVIVTTVHAAKGLEWDYVILPDMEQNQFPNYNGLCKQRKCEFSTNCVYKVNELNESDFLEELSVFYVAVTRAKKEVYFTASKKSYVNENFQPITNISCLLKLPGINISHPLTKVNA